MTHRESREILQPYEVIIRDTTHVEYVKEIWKHNTPDTFHILADFDRTLTQGNVDGRQSPSIIALIRDGNYLSDAYRDEAYALFNTYHRIEIDETISMDVRIAAMHEWWTRHFELLSRSGLTRSLMQQVVRERPLDFREGAKQLLDTARMHQVPTVVLSAAPGDMIDCYMHEAGIDTSYIHILANRYEFDTDGNAVRIKEPIIHSLNKHEIIVDEQDDQCADLHKRSHVLLLGDGIGDIGMIDGFTYDSLLTVGFFNTGDADRKQRFVESFDIVITGDGPMTPINELLAETIFS